MTQSSSQRQSLVGLYRLPLSQRRFAKGALYVSSVLEDEAIASIDFRYFVESESHLGPTRSGFRVPATSWLDFRSVLDMEPLSAMPETIVSERGGRSLRVRYSDDQYGEGVHVRYWIESPSYTGWDKRGLRFLVDDFTKLRELLPDHLHQLFERGRGSDVFSGRTIGFPEAVRSGSPRRRLSRSASMNPSLVALLQELDGGI